tara:strand:+ start:1179 stop:2564 length:1386 start_codon:yes stop_codon:yes gene_type:complete
MTGYINTIADLERQTYGISGISGQLLKQSGAVQALHTGHDTTLGVGSGTATIGDTAALYNRVFGQKVWSMLNRECNALSVISKRPYVSSGWRVLVERPAGGSGNSLSIDLDSTASNSDALIGASSLRADLIGGVPENAKLGTNADGLFSIAPKYSTLFTSPKIIAHQFEFSELAMEMAQIDDGIGDIRAQMREDMGKHHAEVQNQMLVMPLEAYDFDGGISSSVSTIERNYTSLLKIVSSNAELQNMKANDLIANGTFNDTNTANGKAETSTLFGNSDRAATTSSFMNAVVNDGTYSASGQRSLTLSLINQTLREIRQNGGSPKVILTGYDTLQTLSDLLQAQERFMDGKEIVPTVNGVRGVKGQEVGFRVSTYYDIPLIPVAAMPSTKHHSLSTGLSDMLILDTDHLWLSVMKPTQYFEDGISNGNPFGVGTLGNQALYRTIGETGCSYFRGQGKITNLV